MNLMKKISIFALISLLLVTLLSISVFATEASSVDANENESVESVIEESAESEAEGKLPMDLKPENIGERAQIVLEVFVTGMLSVFAVLALLWGIIALSKVFLHDIPNAKKNKNKKTVAPVSPVTPAPAIADAVEETEEVNDGELVAVITAAVAAMIESGDYKNEFANGFRVVSFKRSAKNAWNRK